MTDTYSPSQFVQEDAQPPPSQFTPGLSGLNLGRIDSNVRQISAIEKSWTLPPLPDEAKLDLATMPGADSDSLAGLLFGLDDDYNRDDEAPPEAPIPPPIAPPQLTGVEQSRVILASLSSNPAPERISDDAVKDFKRRAIAKGLLDMDPHRVDSSWSPEFNRIRGEMAFNDYNTRLRGDRPGAVPMDTVMNFINTVTSPTGLLSLATDLDLMIDPGAVAKEWQSWGDKWRKVGDSHGPFDFAKNLVDALTGPIDDLVFPILNVGLMFLGVGAVTNALRVGWVGTKMAEGAGIFSRIYRGIREAQNVEELAQMSWSAKKLTGLAKDIERGSEAWRELGAVSRGAARVGNRLAWWRAQRPVIAVKYGVQQGMRLGLAAAAEQAFPGYQGGGFSLSDIPGVDAAGDALYRASKVPGFMPLELAFAPYNVFAPGTFFQTGTRVVGEAEKAKILVNRGLAQKAGRGVREALGTAPGRAAAGGLLGAAGGAIIGEDRGDILTGAGVGAAAGAGAPLIGSKIEQLHGPLTGALLGTAAGAVLGNGPEDLALGGVVGGLAFVPTSVRTRFLQQAGVGGLDRMVRGLGHALVRTNYQLIDQDQEVVLGFHKGMLSMLKGADLDQWNTDVKASGVIDALAKFQTGGKAATAESRQLAAATIQYGYMSAAIDHIASIQASVVRGAAAQDRAQRLMRNKIINQLRAVDIAQSDEQIINDVAKAMAWTELGGETADLRKIVQYKKDLANSLSADRARILAKQHNDRIGDVVTQLFNEVNFPKPDLVIGQQAGRQNLFGDTWATTPMRGRGDVLASYLPRMQGTLDRFDKFVGSSSSIRRARLDGLFDDARLVSFRDARDRPIVPREKAAPKKSKQVAQANEAITQTLIDPATDVTKVKAADALAGADEAGRMAPATKDFVSKQQLRRRVYDIKDILDARRAWDEFVGKVRWGGRGLEATETVKERIASLGYEKAFGSVTDASRRLDDLTQAEFDELAKALIAKHPKSADNINAILDFGRYHKLSIDDLDNGINRMADDLASREQWTTLGFDSIVTDENGRVLSGVEALGKRMRDTNARIPLTAAEVDLDGLIAFHRAAGDADKVAQLEALKAGLDSDGYKLVHGVEFMMPEDLAFSIPFEDITTRHLNAATIGNFFGRRHPVEAMLKDDRRRRLAIVNALADAMPEGHRLRDLSPEDAEVDNILDTLNDWLRTEQKTVTEQLRTAHNYNIPKRTRIRIESSFTPVRLDDIQNQQAMILSALAKKGYEPDEAMAIWKATTKFRNSDFQDVGLYGIEAWMRSNSQVAQVLKSLSGARYGEDIWKRGAGNAVSGAVIGGAVGVATADKDSTFEEKLTRAVKGGVIGGAAAGTGTVAFNARGTAAGLIRRAEANKYTYLADTYARIRDALRFSVSPFFDLSRYTEGLFLAQTAAPQRLADGSRMTLPLNMSPNGLRRSIRKALAISDEANPVRKMLYDQKLLAKGETIVGAGAKDRARQLYEGLIDGFNKQARRMKDFDTDAIDQAGRWFRQVGVLGFSPTDWMGTAFANLRLQGLDAHEAYNAAREMYNYGTRGRSAAELSANFIFFPFSFQKKAIGHAVKWLNDDIGRAIMIHDALRTYQILDERYNLDEKWRDRLPLLQQLSRLNLFAYGLSPGRFGGINSQLFETAGKLAWNAFIPVGTNIRDASAGKELTDLGKNMLPIWNDVNWMMHDAREVAMPVIAGALGPSTAISADAQARKGYEEWYAFKNALDAQLRERGYELDDIRTKPWLADIKMMYDAKQAELGEKYPFWLQAKSESLNNIIAEQNDRRNRLNLVTLAHMQGRSASPDNEMLADFEATLDQMREYMRLTTGSSDFQDASPQVFDAILRQSAANARANPGWVSIWNTFYRKEFGPIETVMELQ